MTLKQKNTALINGKLSLTEQVEGYLKQAQAKAGLKAFVALFPGDILKQAKKLDQKIRTGEAVGPLAGTILAVKDNIAIKDKIHTCASKILPNFISPFSATVIKKLQAADALIIGKTNLDEFAMGSSTENSAFGPSRNPFNKTLVPGGSSGGSAVAVAAGIADAALGSETGGSVRQPASFTGLVGLKPSYGRVSRYGLTAFASSLDQIGLLTRTVEDAARLLYYMAGHDVHDATSALVPVPDYSAHLNKDIKGVRIGLAEEYFAEGLDEQIRSGIYFITEQLKETGAQICRIHLPLSEYGIADYYILAAAEASSNLARFDGVRYGFRSPLSDQLSEMYEQTRAAGFGAEVKRRIILGTYVLSAGYYNAYYKKAQQVRRLIKEEFDRAFGQVDLILTPTTPTSAFAIGRKVRDPLEMYLSDIYTVGVNLAGLCAMNVPAGFTGRGLPFGLQLIAAPFREDRLFLTGDFIEKMTDKQGRPAKLFAEQYKDKNAPI